MKLSSNFPCMCESKATCMSCIFLNDLKPTMSRYMSVVRTSLQPVQDLSASSSFRALSRRVRLIARSKWKASAFPCRTGPVCKGVESEAVIPLHSTTRLVWKSSVAGMS